MENFKKVFFFILIVNSISLCVSVTDSYVRELNEDNWKQMLEGEWMVEFYAPWCPACKSLAPVWRELSTAARKLSLNVGAVDVTTSPGLSGRFMVTALPTIYHVKEGTFRQYKGSRDVESIISWTVDNKWKQVEPVSSWSAPNSIQMTLLGEFFKFSQTLRGIHTTLMETYGLPTWGSYLIFAMCTILIGAILGLVLVCVIDMLYPVNKKVVITKEEIEALKSNNGQELLNDDIVDECSQSEGEKNSGSDTQSENEIDSAAGDVDTGKMTEIRKRKPRIAD